MDDRELLELSAKAYGHQVKGWVGDRLSFFDPILDSAEYEWNPLNDDGDALRLAARLRLQVLPGKHYGDGCSANPTNHPTPGVTSFVESKDMAVQMRRAITWAAAEIGRAMP